MRHTYPNVPADKHHANDRRYLPPSANVMAADDCDPDPSLSVVDVASGSGCCFYINPTWTAKQITMV
ncbi:MAG: hypothetical protein R2788_03540 [Saprospiraceae bacterium]